VRPACTDGAYSANTFPSLAANLRQGLRAFHAKQGHCGTVGDCSIAKWAHLQHVFARVPNSKHLGFSSVTGNVKIFLELTTTCAGHQIKEMVKPSGKMQLLSFHPNIAFGEFAGHQLA
jgi:hypothetical protein